MTVYAVRLENGTDTAVRMRKADALALNPAGAPHTARGGFRRDGGAEVTVIDGTMQVEVSAFTCWIAGTYSQGGYGFVSDSVQTLTLSDGDPLQDRVDTVVAEVRDHAHDSSGATDARVYVVEGTPGAGQPSLPTACEPLRNINVPAGASAGTGGLSGSNLAADRRTYISALGAPVPVVNASDRDALQQIDGTTVYRLDTHVLETLADGEWRQHAWAGVEEPEDDWHSLVPHLRNGWSQFSSSFPAEYRKDKANNLHLRGRIAPGTNNAVAFQLPTGYRVGRRFEHQLLYAHFEGISAMQMDPDGTCTVKTISGGYNWVNLGGIVVSLH